MKKNDLTTHIAVYCSASDHLPDDWIDTAREIGKAIGQSDATLVYGGVDAGLMREVAVALKKTASGHIIGVVPSQRAALASPLNDRRIDTVGLDDRKAQMQELADIFIVLPGGYGTLDELTGALAYIRFNSVHGKKILLYNPGGLYDHLLAQFETMIERGLMNRASLHSLEVYTSSEQLLARLKQLISQPQL